MSHLSMCIKYYHVKQLSSQRYFATFQAWIWEGLQGVLLVNLSLGQGVFPRYPSLIHVKWMNGFMINTQWAWGS